MSLIFEKFPLGRNGVEEEFYEELIPLEALVRGRYLSPPRLISASLTVWKVSRSSVEKCPVALNHAMADLLLLLLSRFSRVRLCATPETAAQWAPQYLGFSRQEHWNGLPFPSPMHESEKSKWSRSVVSDSSRPHGLQPTRLLRPWDFPGKSTGVGCHCLLWWGT